MTEELASKISQLPPATSVLKTDLVVIVHDPEGAPETQRTDIDGLEGAAVSYRDFDEVATPSLPAAGTLRMFAATDGKIYMLDDAGTVTAIGEGVLPHQVFGRITAVSGDPVNIGGATDVESVYFCPYRGNMARVYDGSGWKYLTFTEMELPLTDVQTGDLTSGSAVLSDLQDTSLLAVGMKASGTGIPAGAVIATINSATQVTLDQAATSDGNDVAVTFKFPAAAKYILAIHDTSGGLQLVRPVAYTTAADLASKITTQDAVEVLASDSGSLVIGTITIGAADGKLTDTDQSRNIRNSYNILHRYALGKASGITLLGGYMSTIDKQNATWTQPATNKANAYDDNIGTYAASTSFLSTTPTIIQVDFGGDVVLDRIDIYFINNTYYRPDRVYIYASDTGAFTGEETTLVNYYAPTADGWSQIALPYPYQARYWRVKAYKNGNDYCRIYEVNFHYGTTLAVMGVPWGCVVELWNGASSVESQRSESLTKPGLVEFTAAVSSVDRLTISRLDGTTPWLEFAIAPNTGEIYSLFKDE